MAPKVRDLWRAETTHVCSVRTRNTSCWTLKTRKFHHPPLNPLFFFSRSHTTLPSPSLPHSLLLPYPIPILRPTSSILSSSIHYHQFPCYPLPPSPIHTKDRSHLLYLKQNYSFKPFHSIICHSSRWYKSSAMDFSRLQIAVDTFLFSSQYTGIAQDIVMFCNTCTKTHTHTYTYTHTYMHTHVHTHIHTNVNTDAHIHTHIYTYIHRSVLLLFQCMWYHMISMLQSQVLICFSITLSLTE